MARRAASSCTRPSLLALAGYVSVCGLSLLFCLSTKTHAFRAPTLPATEEPAGLPAAADLLQTVSSSTEQRLLGVLESLLRTPLGVFVFSNFIIACCAAVAAVTTSVFLEGLTPSEAGRLTQRLLKYLLFKVALWGMVVLPNDVQLLHWLPWLAVIGEMKMFVGLAKDRLASLSVTPTVGLSRHMRTLCLLVFILCSNVLGLALLHRQMRELSWVVSLLFALDLGVISVEATKAALSCVSLLMDEALAVSVPSLHVASTLSGRAIAFWDSWQGKGREWFFYHTELLADVVVHLLTLLHHLHVWLLHGMSFHLVGALLLLDARLVVMSLVTRVKAHMMHRAATHSLDFTFPDATDKLLVAGDSECAICRDRLVAAKQLPCGHLFHLPCLRAWLQQSGHDNFKCPICRRALCVQRSGTHAHGSAGGVQGAAGAARQQPQQQWRVAGHGSAGGLMGGLSLSMSYTNLSAAAGGVRQVSLEEQLLREVGAGFGDAEALLGDAAGAQLLAAASLGSSDAEGFDALLAQALAASLQTANMPPSTQHSSDQSHGRDADAGREFGAGMATPQAEAASVGSGEQQQQQQDMGAVDASCDVEADSGPDQHMCSDSSWGMHQLAGLSCRTTSLPADLGRQPQLQQQVEDMVAWMDPLTGFDDAAPSGVRDTRGSRGLAVLLANDSAATAASSKSNVGAADPGSSGSQSLQQQQQRSSKLARSHRHSRSCSHLPDALQAGAVGGFSWAPRGGSPPVNGHSHEEGLGAAAAPSVELLLAQPREAFRRREGGRWGRRRIVLE